MGEAVIEHGSKGHYPLSKDSGSERLDRSRRCKRGAGKLEQPEEAVLRAGNNLTVILPIAVDLQSLDRTNSAPDRSLDRLEQIHLITCS